MKAAVASAAFSSLENIEASGLWALHYPALNVREAVDMNNQLFVQAEVPVVQAGTSWNCMPSLHCICMHVLFFQLLVHKPVSTVAVHCMAYAKMSLALGAGSTAQWPPSTA